MAVEGTSSRLLPGIQYLRAIAAVGVVFYHLGTRVNVGQPDAYWPEIFKARVDLFFVMSGYIMIVTTRRSNAGPWVFLKRRFLRIVPMYWLATALTLILTGFTGWHTIASFLFIAAPNQHGFMLPLLPPGWTLNFEIAFYLLFAVSMIFGRWQVAVLSLVMAAAIAIWNDTQNAVAQFYFRPIAYEFVVGMWIAYIKREQLIPIALFTASVGFGAPAFGVENKLVIYGFPAAALVMLVVRFEPWPVWRVPMLLGNASYSIFLFHPFALTGSYVFVRETGLPPLLVIPLGIGSAIALGLVSYRWLEKPLTTYMRDKFEVARKPKELSATR